MKKLIIIITTIFVITTAWFGVKPNSEHLGLEYLQKYSFWKFYEGYPILGDFPNFTNEDYKIQNDTIFRNSIPRALLISIELSKLNIKSLDGKEYCIYTNKRFD
jgi:hypothetical protein